MQMKDAQLDKDILTQFLSDTSESNEDSRDLIQVTEPFLPPIEHYKKILYTIWERNWLTNNGPLLKELEVSLAKHLGLRELAIVNNGTTALQLAIRSLGLKGDVITTPFSYVATTSSVVWEGCKPVYVDINPSTFNIDPEKIEAAITSETTGILATHVFGNPCDIESIQQIADKHGLYVLYDAAHGFGTSYKGQSIFRYGDISIASFHATKLYHMIEGGGVVAKDPIHIDRIKLMRNFGHNGPEKFNGIGINGKNSEFHAAMGLCNIQYVHEILKSRKSQYLQYFKKLTSYDLAFQKIEADTEYNHAYFPILFKNESQLLHSVEILNKKGIFPRRYFYPLLSELEYVEYQTLPNAESITKRILCMPMAYTLKQPQVDYVIKTLIESLRI